MDVAPWIWVVFVAWVVGVLLVDVLVFHRKAQEVALREAASWTAVWLALALGFGAVVWAWRGGEDATAYLTGYVIERSLSVDNVFVLAVVFAYFAVEPAYRHRALVVGVLGALVLRAAFIAGGAAALEHVAWSVYAFGAFLVLTGLRLAFREVGASPERNLVVRVLRRVVPMTPTYDGQRFFVRVDRRLVATPMLAVLVAIATTDVAFAAAVDVVHVPAGVPLTVILAILASAVTASLVDERRRAAGTPAAPVPPIVALIGGNADAAPATGPRGGRRRRDVGAP